MWSTRSANSRASPRRLGNGTDAPRLAWTSSGRLFNNGVRKIPVAPDDALGRTDAGAVDEDARGAMLLAGLPDRGRGAVGIAHVAADRNAADAAGHLARGVDIHVEQRDLGAGARKLGGGRGAEPR